MPRSEEKEMFKDFMEEYNTATLPHKWVNWCCVCVLCLQLVDAVGWELCGGVQQVPRCRPSGFE